MDHWIIVPVALPAILAPLIVLLMRRDLTLQRFAGLAGTLALTAVSIALLIAATHTPAEAYHVGNWPAPFGIVLMLDRLSALMLTLTAALALAVQTYAIATGWDARGRHFHALFLFQLMGLNGAFLTAIVISFGMTAVIVLMSLGAWLSGGHDRTDMDEAE